MIEAVNALHRFVGASSWRGYILDAFGESGNTTRPEDIMSYIQKWILPIRHPTGTARISKLSEEEGVVGPDLLVKNAQGLRVVDASIIVSFYYVSSEIPTRLIQPTKPFSLGCHPQVTLLKFPGRMQPR